ncbi:MAG: hypothetical protein C0404_13975 [Verrucomicrobia bacterium]|nr:hypothetical protein [Verrucomicrobiota bacterium]
MKSSASRRRTPWAATEQMHRNHKRTAGFSLIEILTVISIAAILIALVLGTTVYARRAAREAKARSEMERISFALQKYWLRQGSYPSSVGTNIIGDIPGLTFSNAVPFPLPLDPWGGLYYYSNAPQSYVLRSLGADGVISHDDVVLGR